MNTDLTRLGAREAARRIRGGKLSPVELVEACLARIRALDAEVKAWRHVDEPGAVAVARQREAEAQTNRVLGPLHGVPVGIKDIFDVAGMPTTGGARSWSHTRPARDATAVGRLGGAGAFILGKAGPPEFAYRGPAPTRNPGTRNPTPGGASAGSGRAVGARMLPLDLGSQTVGSVLRPAAYCGVIGFKGTHGLVSVDGVIPLAWSLDHVGVFARSVADAALAFSLLVGRELAAVPPRSPRLALVPELLARCEPAVAEQIQAAADRFARAGAVMAEAKLPPSFTEGHAAGLVGLEAEAAAYHEKAFRAHAGEYGKEMRALVEAGLRRTATAYLRADRARLRFRDEVMPLLAAHDALLVPTAPAPAPAGLGSTGGASLCAPSSYAGLPAARLSRAGATSGR